MKTFNLWLLVCVILTALPMQTYADTLSEANTAYETENYTEAARLYKPLAVQGNALAQRRLGLLLFKGWGLAQDFTEAMKWFRLSAENGDIFAPDSIGLMYLGGKGVKADESEARKWFLIGAELGDAQAQNDLGMLYYFGDDDGSGRNFVLAYMWLEISLANPIGRKGSQLQKSGGVVKKMSLDQFSLAKELIYQCTVNDYKNCAKLFDSIQGKSES